MADSFEKQFALTKYKLDGTITNIKKIFNFSKSMSHDNEEHVNMFTGMLAQLDVLFVSFNTLNDQLIELCILSDKPGIFPTADEKKLLDAAQQQYYILIGKRETIKKASAFQGFSAEDFNIALREATTAAITVANTTFSNSRSTGKIHFPQIQLPSFNGEDLSDWPRFRDTYERLVHDEDYSIIEKFHCLNRSLSGTALCLIKHIKISEDNYEQAWNLLKKYFDSKRRLASSYITQLLTFHPSTGKKTKRELLQEFLLNVTENVASFNNIVIPNRADFILIDLALRTLDPCTREEFEVANANVEFPTFDNLQTFVQDRYLALTMMHEANREQPTLCKPSVTSNNKLPPPNKFQPKDSKHHQSTILIAQAKNKSSSKMGQSPTFNKKSTYPTCFICQKPHILRNCFKFSSMNPRQRLDCLKSWPGCKNCLHPGHKTSQCTSNFLCATCKGHHHTLLHLPSQNKDSPRSHIVASTSTQASLGPILHQTSTSLAAVDSSCDALLGTVVAAIQDKNGDFQPVRLVIDSGSQFSLITRDCVSKLGLTIHDFHKSISGVGSCPAFSSLGKIEYILRPRDSSIPEFHSEAVVVPHITHNLPQVVIPIHLRQKYDTYHLADPEFWKPGPVEFLLGADLFCDIISGLPTKLSNDEPCLLNTVFGHVIIGQLPPCLKPKQHTSVALGVISHGENMETIMQKFWEVEEVTSILPKHSPEEQACEDHFILTHTRNQSGRYIVRYPFKSELPFKMFSSSRNHALNRLYNLEQRLKKLPSLKADYDHFMREYYNLGHMRLAKTSGEYYIPHHAVYKIENGKEKIRVVFDASARTSYGSLNDQLLVGPKLQNDISNILLRFRRHRIAFSCDIVKMYRNIEICNEDLKYQHILWRFDPQDPVDDYELLTVTYGTSSAPYQSQRVIKQLVADEGSKFPLAVDVLLNDIYIDDIPTGAPTIEGAIELKQQLTSILSSGGFELGKWCSNYPSILHDVAASTPTSPVTFNDDEATVKILGLHWDPVLDVFAYDVKPIEPIFTKRAILSAIGKIYDPLGFLSPCTFWAKNILQETWKTSLNWDDEVPPHLKKAWLMFLQDLPNLKNIKIPRYLNNINLPCDVVGFCDASSKGFCACLYLRLGDRNSSHIYLIKAKTRLAPIKPLTIPRLELNAALLLSQLYSSVKGYLELFNINSVTFFTDASIVLGWLKTPTYRLKTYVANRIVKILDLVDVEWWRHVSTLDNPADCGSRGLLPAQLINHNLWWFGPTWINLSPTEWPSSGHEDLIKDLPELKPEASSLISTKGTSDPSSIVPDLIQWTERFSSYPKFIRVVAYLLRFKANTTHNKSSKLTGPISSTEFNASNMKIILCLQHHYYPEAFGVKPKWSTQLSSLNAFLDDRGLLRVGGRISKSNLSFDHKHPILLPRRSHFTNLLIDHYHKICLHVGPTALQNIINRNYWIPSAKNLIKQRKRKCLSCLRFSKLPPAPRMGDLPATRFTEVRPFHITGVDFAGPFLIKESTRRNAPISKAYLSLFICLSTKALFLELVPALTSEAFLDALEIFIARRGAPVEIISDRGTNFIGTSNYLREVKSWINKSDTETSLINHGVQYGIKWSFNPPSSPHFGGIYEAGVKSVKSLLVKTLGSQPYSATQLRTMFAKIELILNSRPLSPLSTDPNDLQPLTPGHFLVSGPLTPLVEQDLHDVPENRLTHWQLLRRRVQTFWKRWRTEYLLTLQRRSKWLKGGENLNVGDLVLLTDTNHQPYHWPLARITDVHPGEDGVVRVVTLKTSSGTYKRPVVKLIPLRDITKPHSPLSSN